MDELTIFVNPLCIAGSPIGGGVKRTGSGPDSASEASFSMKNPPRSYEIGKEGVSSLVEDDEEEDE